MDTHAEGIYRVVRRLDDGQEVFVARRADLIEARELIESLREYWPGDYCIDLPVSINFSVPQNRSTSDFSNPSQRRAHFSADAIEYSVTGAIPS